MPMFRGKVRGELRIGWECLDNRPTPVYALHGGPIVYVPKNAEGCAPDRLFTVSSYRFYPIGEDFQRDAVIAAVVSGPPWRLAVLRYYVETIPKRLLATAYVWGLADYPFGEEQTWRSVYLFQWLNKTLGSIFHANH